MTTIEDQVEFLTEYNQWVVEVKARFQDTSPEAFLEERARNQAVETLLKIQEIINDLGLAPEESFSKIEDLIDDL